MSDATLPSPAPPAIRLRCLAKAIRTWFKDYGPVFAALAVIAGFFYLVYLLATSPFGFVLEWLMIGIIGAGVLLLTLWIVVPFIVAIDNRYQKCLKECGHGAGSE